MFALSKKMFYACILALVVFAAGAWQGNPVVLAEGQKAGVPETPLYSGLTWGNPSSSAQEIRININGDMISLSGKRYEASQQFAVGALPQDLLNYYSNETLAKSGWNSHDTFEFAGGARQVFYHESGVFLSVDFTPCPGGSSTICIAVWKSDQTTPLVAPVETAGPDTINTTNTFVKKTPTNGATDVSPTSAALSWAAYTPTPDKYAYCVKVGSACVDNDPNWTSAYSTSVTLTNLSYDKTYYWQVRAITCVTCVPKTFVYADGGTVWTFKTKQATEAVIVGNVGVGGAVLKYTNGTPQSVTANGIGNYSITVPFHWTGTITPVKSGYLFTPKNASFSDLTALQTIQNFNVTTGYAIKGSVGLQGVTMSYTDGTPQTVTSNSKGRYKITVPGNWSGTVTPSKTGFTFSPDSRIYSNVTTKLTGQNYTPLVSISGNAGAGATTLSYMDGVLKTVNANGGGDYSLIVPVGWTGVVTPSLTGFIFNPVNRSYANLQTGQTAQDYTAIDNPFVLSSVRLNTSPTSAANVDFKVTFSESVTGVDTGDFGLTTTGLTGASITQVTGSGNMYTVTVDTGSGSGTLRLDVVDNDSIKDGSNNPLGGAGAGNGNFSGGEVYDVRIMTVLSTNSEDGWILESTETSGVGGSLNSNASTLRIGDDATDRQYISVLSFDTSVLPDTATITSVTLKFKHAGVVGTNPFNILNDLLVDVNKGSFSNDPVLQLSDFNAADSKDNILTFTNSLVDNWYSQSFDLGDFQYINLSGVTQFRLHFTKDDNDDMGADYLKIFSGNASETKRPQLIIEYTP